MHLFTSLAINVQMIFFYSTTFPILTLVCFSSAYVTDMNP